MCVCVCVCVVSAVNDGKCSLRWSATVSVVQESMWWKGNQIRDTHVLKQVGLSKIVKGAGLIPSKRSSVKN